MSDTPEYVFQCDSCGERVPVDKAKVFYSPVEDLPDGRVRVIMSTFCGSYCARTSTYLITSG